MDSIWYVSVALSS